MVLLVPGFGGTAKQPLLQKLVKALAALGLPAEPVTLPKRRPGPGLKEETDALEALWLEHGKGPIVGRSFGGRVAVRLALRQPVPAIVLLGFPLRPEGKRRLEDEKAFAALTCPVLVLQGDKDPLGSLQVLHEFAPKSAIIEPVIGATHAYGKHEKAVIERTAAWLKDRDGIQS